MLTLRDAKLTKRGDQLTGSARVTEADLRAALPFLEGVQPVASSNGQLTLRGTATLLGFTATLDATVSAEGGRLDRARRTSRSAGLATITVFSDPRIEVDSVAGGPDRGRIHASAAGAAALSPARRAGAPALLRLRSSGSARGRSRRSISSPSAVDRDPLLVEAVAVAQVTVRSSSDWWSIVIAHGVPISSWRRYRRPIAPPSSYSVCIRSRRST